jgi:hypothetical protein
MRKKWSTTSWSIFVHPKEHPQISAPQLHLRGAYSENAALGALVDK